MKDEPVTIQCSNCGEPLEVEVEKCTKCGSLNIRRSYTRTLKERFDHPAQLRGKQKVKGKGRLQTKFREELTEDGRLRRRTIIAGKGKKYHRIEEQNEKGEWVIVHEDPWITQERKSKSE